MLCFFFSHCVQASLGVLQMSWDSRPYRQPSVLYPRLFGRPAVHNWILRWRWCISSPCILFLPFDNPWDFETLSFQHEPLRHWVGIRNLCKNDAGRLNAVPWHHLIESTKRLSSIGEQINVEKSRIWYDLTDISSRRWPNYKATGLKKLFATPQCLIPRSLRIFSLSFDNW